MVVVIYIKNIPWILTDMELSSIFFRLFIGVYLHLVYPMRMYADKPTYIYVSDLLLICFVHAYTCAEYDSATKNMSTNILFVPVTVGAPFYVENMLEKLDQEVGHCAMFFKQSEYVHHTCAFMRLCVLFWVFLLGGVLH